jgi:hypothetical protein
MHEKMTKPQITEVQRKEYGVLAMEYTASVMEGNTEKAKALEERLATLRREWGMTAEEILRGSTNSSPTQP